MVVYISTDASMETQTRIAGYGFWIISELGTIKRYGRFRKKVGCPTEAEMKAICNALYCIVKDNRDKITKIVISTDSQMSINILSRKKNVKHKRFAPLYSRVKSIKGKIPIIYNKVKSHSGDTWSPDSVMNDWCDKMSKQGRKS